MLVKLVLDNHDILSFDAATERKAIDYASDICQAFDLGGIMIINGFDIEILDYAIEIVPVFDI